MGKIVIATTEEAPEVQFPKLHGVTPNGAITTRAVVTGDRPIFLWSHELGAGAGIRWSKPSVGHVVYVWHGEVQANGRTFGTNSVLGIEHHADLTVIAEPSGATLLQFHNAENSSQKPRRAGGSVHLHGPEGLFKAYHRPGDPNTIWLDSDCPTCELWMHRTQFNNGRPVSNFHHHTEDEIIFVVEGGLVLGRNAHKPGTALAIDANTRYGLGIAEGGAAFLNFRPTEPYLVRYVGNKAQAPQSEKKMWHDAKQPSPA